MSWLKKMANRFREQHAARSHGDTSFADSLLTPQYPNQIEMNRQMFQEGGDPKPIEYTYKDKATWIYNNLQDTFTNDERQDKRKERRKTRKNQRQGQRAISTTGPEGSPRMEQPQFKQDRQAVFDENVEAFEKKASRKAKAEGGSILADDREQYGLGGLTSKLAKRLLKTFGRDKEVKELTKDIADQKEYIKNKGWVEEREKWADHYGGGDPYEGEGAGSIAVIRKAERTLTPWGSKAKLNELESKLETRLLDLGENYPNIVEVGKGRTKKAEGGELDDQMEDLMNEEETHTMPDGTEMEGATHGEYDEQMEGLMDKETPMLPDEEMEEDYVDFVIEETLSDEDKNYLISALEQDDRLSEIVDQVVESATEFSGSGPIEGPGTEKSDSIPARLSDGEFVFTAKAVEEIGADNLEAMMMEAEAGADQRQGVAYGGMVEDEDDPKAVPIQTTGLLAAQGNIPNVVKPNRQVDEEMLKASPRRYYVPLSG